MSFSLLSPSLHHQVLLRYFLALDRQVAVVDDEFGGITEPRFCVYL